MVLKKLFREKTGRREYVLVSRKDPTKKLKWFGIKRPSSAIISKEEKRIQFFKHFSSNVNVRAHLRKGKYVNRHLRKIRLRKTYGNGVYGFSRKGYSDKSAQDSIKELQNHIDKCRKRKDELGSNITKESQDYFDNEIDEYQRLIDRIKRTNNFSSMPRPQKLGTSWKGKKFIHGKRRIQPSEFSTLWTMKPSEVKTKFHKKLPRLPEGSKVIIGPLKKGGIEIQSYLKPLKK